MALKIKQKMFVKEYLVDFNATGAAVRAGYAPKRADQTGYLLLRNAEIQAAIQKEVDAREKRTEISADYVLTSLKTVAQRCMQEIPVFDREGNPTGEFQFEHAGANRALELLGKNLKLFTDKVDLRTIKDIDDLSEEEQIALAKALQEKFCK